jgi:predicted nucleic acid-binding protein
LVRNLFGEGGIAIFALGSDDMVCVEQVATTFSLDFDDAYQYVVAEKSGLTLVSLDTDFDRTDLKRIIPSRIL